MTWAHVRRSTRVAFAEPLEERRLLAGEADTTFGSGGLAYADIGGTLEPSLRRLRFDHASDPAEDLEGLTFDGGLVAGGGAFEGGMSQRSGVVETNLFERDVCRHRVDAGGGGRVEAAVQCRAGFVGISGCSRRVACGQRGGADWGSGGGGSSGGGSPAGGSSGGGSSWNQGSGSSADDLDDDIPF
jgi:hypothetical protein